MKFKLLSLRTAIALTTTLVIFSPVTVTASDDDKSIDMSNLTCEEFNDLGKTEKMMSLVWLSGWMAQQQNDFNFTPDRGVMSDFKDTLEAACENNETDLVINRLAISGNDRDNF